MSEDGVVLIEGDPELAAKCYPSGTKNEATAMCLCGSVEISLKTDEPSVSGFCHCWACRRAHSAPLYQVIYTDNANIDPATGSLREGEFEIMVTKGFELLRPGDPGPGNPNWESQDDNPNFGGIGRLYCQQCGVVMMNALYQRPHSIFNDTDDPVDFISVFPGTFTEKMSEFIEAWQPTMHVHCESSILPFDAINDGLDKFATWPPPEEE
jgi:hypothetical protein|tara:strand:+ start:1458 stop:2087 length:630 start_codon:yes stop_codon:yes gene_type:complete